MPKNATNVSSFQINVLTEAQYIEAMGNGEIDENALYLTPEKKLIKSVTQAEYDAFKKAGTLDDDILYVTPAVEINDATQNEHGYMSAADKIKLDGIANGANNFTYSLPTASATVLGGVKTGSNITNTSGVLSLTKANVTSALGYTPPRQDTTYGLATTSSNGLMSYSDKSKLDGLSNITVDTELSASSTNPVQNKAVYAKNLWLYRAYFYVDSWDSNGDQYYQGAYVYAQDGGPTLSTGATLSTPMTTQSSNMSTNKTLQATLNIINGCHDCICRCVYTDI